MRADLVVVRGRNQGYWTPVGAALTVGRDPACDLQLFDEALSRRHFRIVQGEDGFLLEDLDSHNGTYVNELRVRASALHHQDRIRCGASELQFLCVSAPAMVAGPAAPAVVAPEAPARPAASATAAAEALARPAAATPMASLDALLHLLGEGLVLLDACGKPWSGCLPGDSAFAAICPVGPDGCVQSIGGASLDEWRAAAFTASGPLRREFVAGGRHFLLAFGPITPAWGAPPSPASAVYALVYRDLTDQKRSEAALRTDEEGRRQAQKMEAMGRLAGGLAHDFNNLLMVILGHAEFLLAGLPDPGRLREDAETILRACERAASLTHPLLAFSRKQRFELRVLDLNQIVADIKAMLTRLLGEAVRIDVALDPACGNVRADVGQLGQVLLNLALNSRDAMPKGGSLRLATGRFEADAAYQARHPNAAAGSYVRLTVSDTGCGMDAATLEHLFEPFFTTKERGKGTGLGLATVYGIVEQCGGVVEVESRLGEGTTFRILLPRATEEPVPATVDAVESPAVGGDVTILLVEDARDVRNLLRASLRSLGFRVLSAASGAAAIKIARRYAGKIGLLVTDLVMPRMSGQELAEQVLRVSPAVKILFLTGYADSVVLRQCELGPGRAFLAKPFAQGALACAVRSLLALSAG